MQNAHVLQHKAQQCSFLLYIFPFVDDFLLKFTKLSQKRAKKRKHSDEKYGIMKTGDVGTPASVKKCKQNEKERFCMKISFRHGWAMLSAAVLSLTALPLSAVSSITTISAAAAAAPVVENLDRGIVAIKSGNGILVSWRFLASDQTGTEFRLYRDDQLLMTSKGDEATCFYDESGSASARYRVDSLVNGTVQTTSTCSLISGTDYFQIPMDVPTASDCTYSPNDCSVGDVDGDGVYELFVKWDPSNSKDNSQKGKTGNVYIDC